MIIGYVFSIFKNSLRINNHFEASLIFLTENLFPNNFARVAPYQATLFEFQPPRDPTCALDLMVMGLLVALL